MRRAVGRALPLAVVLLFGTWMLAWTENDAAQAAVVVLAVVVAVLAVMWVVLSYQRKADDDA
jgi:hypothetical protein